MRIQPTSPVKIDASAQRSCCSTPVSLRVLAGLLLSAVPGLATPPISSAAPRSPHYGMRATQGADTAKPASSVASDQTKGTFWIIPHTHWEGAVFKTRE